MHDQTCLEITDFAINLKTCIAQLQFTIPLVSVRELCTIKSPDRARRCIDNFDLNSYELGKSHRNLLSPMSLCEKPSDIRFVIRK